MPALNSVSGGLKTFSVAICKYINFMHRSERSSNLQLPAFKSSAGRPHLPVASRQSTVSRRRVGEQKTYTRDKEIRLGINFKWDALPCWCLVPGGCWLLTVGCLVLAGRLLRMPRNLIWWHSSTKSTASTSATSSTSLPRLQSNLWLNYRAIFNVSNKLVYKIIPTHRCLGLLPLASLASLSLLCPPPAAACGLLGFWFMRGRDRTWIRNSVASFSFAAINLLLNATIWFPLRSFSSLCQPPTPHSRWSTSSSLHAVNVFVFVFVFLGWSPTLAVSWVLSLGVQLRCLSNKNFVKWQ